MSRIVSGPREGYEQLCSLTLPLPLTLASALMSAICEAAEDQGYSDVSMTTDMTTIIAKPPERGGG